MERAGYLVGRTGLHDPRPCLGLVFKKLLDLPQARLEAVPEAHAELGQAVVERIPEVDNEGLGQRAAKAAARVLTNVLGEKHRELRLAREALAHAVRVGDHLALQHVLPVKVFVLVPLACD